MKIGCGGDWKPLARYGKNIGTSVSIREMIDGTMGVGLLVNVDSIVILGSGGRERSKTSIDGNYGHVVAISSL